MRRLVIAAVPDPHRIPGTDAQSARTISPACRRADRQGRSETGIECVSRAGNSASYATIQPYANVSGVEWTRRTFKAEGSGALQHVGPLAVLDLPGQEADRRNTIDGKNGGVAGHGAAGLRQVLWLMVRAAAVSTLAGCRTVCRFTAMIVVSGALMIHR